MANELTIDFDKEVTYEGENYYPTLHSNNGRRVVIQLEKIEEGFYERKALELEEQITRTKEDKLRHQERQVEDLKRMDDQVKKLEAEKAKVAKKIAI